MLIGLSPCQPLLVPGVNYLYSKGSARRQGGTRVQYYCNQLPESLRAPLWNLDNLRLQRILTLPYDLPRIVSACVQDATLARWPCVGG